ncbi:MAG: glycosyltransferase family 2 protein [Prevotellaceae bacterium]|jgi:glycosyltransferase involved in cell wall biosynthesis|nr:glycosyltransferase family 2 protein [Prevotellaceae bacterium]
MSNTDSLYIVIPAYNEEENISAIVSDWHPVVSEIGNGSKLVVVDDGSKDSTYSKLVALQSDYPCLTVLSKPNSGHGATCIYAYKYAIENHADYIFQTDSDGQTTASEFGIFWENRQQYDFQIGKRINREDGKSRVFVTNVLRIVLWLVFGENIADANTPFRLMKAARLGAILKVVPNDSFLSNVLISVIAVRWKERCIWRPITFKARQAGESFIKLKKIVKIGWKALKDFREINSALKRVK